MPHWNSQRDSFELRCPTAKLRQPRTRPKEPHMGPGGPRKRLQDGVGRVSRRLQEGSGATCRANGGRHLVPRGRQDGPKRASRRPEKGFQRAQRGPWRLFPLMCLDCPPFARRLLGPRRLRSNGPKKIVWHGSNGPRKTVWFFPPVRLLKIRSGPFWAVE